MPTPPPRKKKPWGLIAAALVVVVVLAGAGVFFLGGNIKFGSDDEKSDNASTSSVDSDGGEEPEGTAGGSPETPSSSEPTSEAPAAGGGTVDPASLPTLLASVTDLNETLAANLVPAAAVQNSPFDGMTVQPSNCAGPLMPGIDYVYKTANYTGFAGQVLTDEATNTKVMQAVISFSSETEATRFFNDQFTAWRRCDYTEVTASGGGQSQTAKTGVAADGDGTATLLIWPDTQDSGRGCQRGMTPRKNVIVDVRVCSQNVGSSGYTLARDIGAKITGHR
ncbi:sensor domain-containing protein [Mycolicibacterium setense]|uniref:sensor domain-containing protein n=1 Tax=Mycolicibacterium setense TaxID=431269 RepID=UPI0013F4E981|nr:sensor domain-containing protein [Mycolicibacterium setense]